jgi:hypothetical protein
MIPIAPESHTNDFFDVVRARIIKGMLEEHDIDIVSIWNKVQNIMERHYFIGCVSDGSFPDHMWHKYAMDDGACVWFEPDYAKLKKIIYEEYLAKADDLRKKYSELMIRIATSKYEEISKELESLTKELIDLSVASFYTKKPDNYEDTEWRQIVVCSSDADIIEDGDGNRFIINPIPGKIVKVESHMPDSENKKLIEKMNPSIELIIDKPHLTINL